MIDRNRRSALQQRFAIASALAPSNLSPTWTTRPYLSDRCLQDSPVCSGQLNPVEAIAFRVTKTAMRRGFLPLLPYLRRAYIGIQRSHLQYQQRFYICLLSRSLEVTSFSWREETRKLLSFPTKTHLHPNLTHPT